MEAPLVCIVIISVLAYTTDHVRAQGISASENPIPVGTNVTLFSDHPVNTGAWIFNNEILVLLFPGGQIITPNFIDRVGFNPNTSSLTVISARLEDSGTYSLQDVTSDASQLELSVQEPISNVSLTTNGTDLVESNDTAVLTCAAATGTSLHYTWLNDTSEVVFDSFVQLSADSSQLTIIQVTRYDEGPFRCNVTNGVSNEISPPVTLNISYGPTNAIVSVTPEVDTHIEGSNITLLCSAESKPAATIHWMVDGMDLNHSEAELNLTTATESHSGDYQCLLYNSVTSRFSSASAMIRIIAPITAVMVNDMGMAAVAGMPFTLNCHVSGEAETILWWMNSDTVSADNTTIFGAGNKTLTLHPVYPSDTGLYMCHAFNAVSNMTSDTYYLEVNFGPDKPMITAPSVALTGSEVFLNCSSTSNPPSTYSWSFNDTEVATTANYLAGPLTLNMSGTYTCMAFNNITGRNSSAYHMLTVLAPVTMANVTAPATHPILNGTFNLTCEAEGSIESITWRHNGALLYTNGTRSLTMNNATLTFEPLMLSDNGIYTCEAYNPLSNFTSENYNLNVIFGPGVPNVTKPLEALEGTSIQLNCSAMSYPPSQYTWFFDGTPVANTSVYLTPALSQNMSGTYTCEARNTITGENSSADTMLTVIEEIKDVRINVPTHPPVEGYNYTMTCNVSGPVDQVLWLKNGQLIVADDRVMMSIDNLTVTFEELHRNDTGQYHCYAINRVQTMASHPHILDVNFGPDTPLINGGPLIAAKGESVKFTCSAVSRPGSHFSWWYNMSLVANSSVLAIDSVMLNMSGHYTCKAQNPVSGKNSSSSLMLQVIEDINSVRVEQNTIPIEGENFTLTCEVDGPYTSIQWRKDDEDLPSNKSTTNHSHYYIHENRLHFAPLTRYDDGTYMCVASNLLGRQGSPPYELLVNYGPVSVTIIGPDISPTEFAISIECVADSRPESEYQWFLNDAELPSFTESLIEIPVVNSNFTCKATNPVTNITMSKTKFFSSASGLNCPSQKILVIVSVFIMSLPLLFR
ncbi:carcinoembryonic antigen-related cell adhesion molecule 1 [Corythoichthys intestinalis]|uniref:carcinoembryonic antigen-related cell adhesion molecule 1 n=1 Tax=Corythoichthys intestinalis TaxID=161448 RepID=UPI0025A534AA|nr:carcinoembryonic antigen-related cell adhesion molecule 1 [Corythoichthys intestinalis]